MPDRRRRTAFHLPPPERAPMMLRDRQSSSPGSSSSGPSGPSGSSGSSSSDSSGPSGSSRSSKPQDDNPFAAPPENRPDQPWQPRHPAQSGADGNDGDDKSGGSGNRPTWGSKWSNQQPGRQNGGFGSRPGGNGPGGQGGGKGGKGGPDGGSGVRWDPTDPAQRRARYAVLGGMWAFFFALFDFPEIALLLGALSVYWSVSALRAKPKGPAASSTRATAEDVSGTARPAVTGDTAGGAAGDGASPGTGRTGYGRPQTTAAVSGLVTALLALTIVATTFTVQLVYRDYYTCVNDALTKSGALSCNDLLPEPLEPFFGVKK
ncbi:hypothetical protein F0344_13365 [Streptomyces finlayi]|uniref:Integral membrane protein n=1 Tax=Streptomyces finlayi TaxID=67296 RepID=A0A7G7BJG2_9ACTN|nr:hypothetical protein [Streptomyces finlayi]QNE75477.1 hypothetical protein F0344_13365 [Streptomyces finlayi]